MQIYECGIYYSFRVLSVTLEDQRAPSNIYESNRPRDDVNLWMWLSPFILNQLIIIFLVQKLEYNVFDLADSEPIQLLIFMNRARDDVSTKFQWQ